MNEPIIRYKLVTQDYKTRVGFTNETDWLDGVEVCAIGMNNELCTDLSSIRKEIR